MSGGGDILDLWGSLLVVTELHGIFTLTLGGGTEVGAETEHAVQGAVGINGKLVDASLSIVDSGTALVQQSDNITLELRGSGDNSLHQRLKDSRVTLGKSLAEGLLGSVLESHFGRISHVGSTVVNNHAGTQDLVADQRTLLARQIETLLASVQELLGDGTSDNLLLELVLLEGAGGSIQPMTRA